MAQARKTKPHITLTLSKDEQFRYEKGQQHFWVDTLTYTGNNTAWVSGWLDSAPDLRKARSMKLRLVPHSLLVDLVQAAHR